MTPTDELFQVIKSLKQTEKRYFKVFASMHDKGENGIYIKLFNVIEKQKEYDEKLLKEKFKGEVFIRQLTVTKYNLLNLILKSLRNYYGNVSAVNKANQLLMNIEILYGKGFYALCKTQIDKIKKLADQHEIYGYYMEALDWEKKVIHKQEFLNSNYSHIENIVNEGEIALAKLGNINHFSNLNTKIWYWFRKKGKSRNAGEYQKHYGAIIKDPVLKENNAITNRSKFSFYSLKALVLNDEKEYEQSLKYSKKSIDLFEENPELISQSPDVFLGTIYNLASDLERLDKNKEAILTLEKVKNVAMQKAGTKDKILKLRKMQLPLMLKTHIYNKTGEFDKTIALIPEFEAGVKDFKDFTTRIKHIIIYNISCAFIGSNNFKNALKWVGKILNYNKTDLAEHIHLFAQIINLIIHFELRNDEHLAYIVKSTYRYLYKRNRLYKVESTLLEFIRKTSTLESRKDFIPAFKELKKKLVVLSKDPYEARAFEYFDFISWLDSKIENRSFAEIIKKKVKS